MEAGLSMAGADFKAFEGSVETGDRLWWGKACQQMGTQEEGYASRARSSLGEAWSHVKSTDMARAPGLNGCAVRRNLEQIRQAVVLNPATE